MRIDGSLPIAKYAAELPGAIGVFESLGLDYACAGERSLDDAAHAEGIAPETVIANLRRLNETKHVEPWSERPLRDLLQHLTAEHHRFVRNELAKIAVRLAESCTSPSHPPPDLVTLRTAFTRLADVVLPHLHREEDKVFPAIAALETAWQSNETAMQSDLPGELHRIAEEHGAIAGQLRTMRELRLRLEQSNDLPPRCMALLQSVATLEAHLHEYMFLENCVLFPRALATV